MEITRKELEKIINEIQKTERKKFGYKKRSSILFKKYKEYFLSIHIYATGLNNDKVVVRGELKPYCFDDLFWEVFKMPENSNEPMGLRANGAFSLWSFCVENHEKIIKNYLEVAPYLCEMIAEVDRRLCTKVDELGDDLKNFINHADMAEKTGMYDKALGEMLLYIKCKQYDKALDLATVQIEAGNFGSFKNEGKYIYEHVAEYCKEHTRG